MSAELETDVGCAFVQGARRTAFVGVALDFSFDVLSALATACVLWPKGDCGLVTTPRELTPMCLPSRFRAERNGQ